MEDEKVLKRKSYAITITGTSSPFPAEIRLNCDTQLEAFEEFEKQKEFYELEAEKHNYHDEGYFPMITLEEVTEYYDTLDIYDL